MVAVEVSSVPVTVIEKIAASYSEVFLLLSTAAQIAAILELDVVASYYCILDRWR